MSGIIGDVGSKSGVIGTTELDYEEGLWSPDVEGFGGSAHTFTAVNSTYTKIGRMVYARCTMSGTSMTGTADVSYLTGLPFVANKPGMGTQSTTAFAQGGVCSPSGSNLFVGTFTSISSMIFTMYYETV